MTDILGIKYDMDLRSPSDKADGEYPIVTNAVHKYYNTPMYRDAFDDSNGEIIRSIFSDLAKKENYPMYMHCTHGRDRTGTVCYMLGVLLRMSADDLYKEYDLSAFTDSYSDIESYTTFREIIAVGGRNFKGKD